MEQKKKHRRVLRIAFAETANEFEELLETNAELMKLKVCSEMLQHKYDDLQIVEEDVYDTLLTTDILEEELLEEIKARDSYRARFTELKFRSNENEKDERSVSGDTQILTNEGNSSANVRVRTGRRKFKLPTIELKQFSGNIKDWLPFWAQFKKVHEDVDIDASDKIQYLIQSTSPNSRARQLVESFPVMGENYEKIIESLKSRFGREDLQVEVYVRELLKLILNKVGSKEKVELSALYDKMETQLRALETLGVTSDKCSAMLFPLIESCLPNDLLRIWQRSSFSTSTDNTVIASESTIEKRLRSLMSFLKSEADNEQRISLAAEGFGLNFKNDAASMNKKLNTSRSKVPTATGLINCNMNCCIFCGGTHPSDSCFKAQEFTLDQKKAALTEKKACFRCLKIGHQSSKCRARMRCIVCSRSHVTLMCPNLPDREKVQSAKKEEVESLKDKEVQALTNRTSSCVFLQTLRVVAVGVNCSRKVRALIDTGSQRSYILKSTAEELGYTSERTETIIHGLFGGAKSEQKHQTYNVRLSKGNYSCTFETLDQILICNDVPSIFSGPWAEELKAQNISISDIHDSGPIELLIGADVAGKLYTGKMRVLSCGLVAVETLLGWTLMGKVPNRLNSDSALISLSLLCTTGSITDLWELDVLGIRDPIEKKSSEELAKMAKNFFLETVTVNNEGRYEVRLPWIDGHLPLPNNYMISKKRLENTMQKIKQQGIFESYNAVFKEWLGEGIIERVVTSNDVPAHYLPHRPVVKETSLTTKIRPVFDASAREKDKPSLNQCLEKGPNLIELIPSVLLKFREHRLGVISDIRKAFLQISLHEEDRNFLRFLWVDHLGNEIIFRHRRVVFGVNSSPFLLGATIDHHLLKILERNRGSLVSTDTILTLQKSFYVDNCVTSVPDEGTLKKFIREASEIMSEGKFDLRGWEFTRCDEGHYDSVSVLGLKWNVLKDTLYINEECLKELPVDEDKTITKRVILSIAQRVYDPIGFVCPTTLQPKLLLRQIWEKGLGWDVVVDDEIEHAFRCWTSELFCLKTVEIPRWIGIEPGNMQSCSLHTFCDASSYAYSAAVFLRVTKGDQVSVRLLAAKTRVAPLKKMTIPRLELLAATIGSRLYDSVRTNLEGDYDCYWWSDSTTVLSWITRKEEWATFVWNRVTEIRILTKIDAWRHIPGNLNPADLLSRGCSPKQLIKSRWWEGPSWLYESPEEWPQSQISEGNEEEILKEKKKKVSSLLCCSADEWHLMYFFKFMRTVRMIAWILRFKFNTRNPAKRQSEDLNEAEIEAAERLIVKIIQGELFHGDSDKQLYGLNPVRDEFGVIRTQSRICRRNDTNSFRFPMVLPSKHKVVDCLIMYTHEKSCHVGTNGLMNILREKYWILGGRRTIRKAISSCVVCKKFNVNPSVVQPPPLPLDRVRDAVAFEITGVDFAGPLYLKSEKKAWVCLFTCAVFRAVHLELTTCLSTDSFLQVLRRFIARRGRPKTIYSDNATNFVGSNNALQSLDWEKIKRYSSIEQITWRFSPPHAPWWGGFWERLIGVMKNMLRKVLGRASLNYEELNTLLCDCEAIINSRPLTYMSDDPKELIPLSPVMFLREQAESGVPDCDQVDRLSLCKKMLYKQKLRDDLRQRFRCEYLGQLKVLMRKKKKRGGNQPLSVGDVVLVGNDNSKRLEWPLGRVSELIIGKDGHVRLVRVTTRRGELLRPVQRLYSLECISTPVEKMKKDIVEDESVCAGVSEVITDLKSRVPRNETTVTRSGRVCKKPIRFL